jgi:DNA-binding PadR family transcriptional regulator
LISNGDNVKDKNVEAFTQQLERGLFYLYILWVANEQLVSGVDISRIEHKHGHDISASRIYPTLHYLMERGYLAIEKIIEHGKVHKYYRTTEEGKEVLKKVRNELGEPMKEFLAKWLDDSMNLRLKK